MADSKPQTPGMKDIYQHISSKTACITFMRELGLLRKEETCHICMTEMETVPKSKSNTSDLESWACPKCKTNMSIRTGSIFAVSGYISLLLFVQKNETFNL